MRLHYITAGMQTVFKVYLLQNAPDRFCSNLKNDPVFNFEPSSECFKNTTRYDHKVSMTLLLPQNLQLQNVFSHTISRGGGGVQTRTTRRGVGSRGHPQTARHCFVPGAFRHWWTPLVIRGIKPVTLWLQGARSNYQGVLLSRNTSVDPRYHFSYPSWAVTIQNTEVR